MALKPRLTRAAVRLCVDALERYLPEIGDPGRRQVAIDTLRTLRAELMHTALNREKQREQRTNTTDQQ